MRPPSKTTPPDQRCSNSSTASVLGFPLGFADVSAMAWPYARATARMNSESGTRTPSSAASGFNADDSGVSSVFLRNKSVMGPGSNSSSKPGFKCATSAYLLTSDASPTHTASGT